MLPARATMGGSYAHPQSVLELARGPKAVTILLLVSPLSLLLFFILGGVAPTSHVMRNEMIASKPRKRDGRQKRENLVKERKKCLLSKEQRKIDPIFLRRIHVV